MSGNRTLAALCAASLAFGPGFAAADTIRFWTTEDLPDRMAKQEAMA